MKILLFLFLLLVSFNLDASAQTQSASQKDISDEEYNLLAKAWCGDSLWVVTTYTMAVSISPDMKEESALLKQVRGYYAKENLPDVTDDLFKDFLNENKERYSFERKFNGCKSYTLITTENLSEIYRQQSWGAFLDKYPGATEYHTFSRIGFSPDKKQAMLLRLSVCGLKCLSFDVYFFVKENDKWVEILKGKSY